MAKSMRVMTSMELPDEDKIDAPMPISMAEKPDFPYGLRICLTEVQFKQLDLDPSDAEIGGMVHGHFMGRITSVSAEKRESGECCRVEIQIEDLVLEEEGLENEEYND